jgi:hypothetical protein
MHETKDPQLLEAVKKMNHCCGPFARMRHETRTYCINLLLVHNAAFENSPTYAGIDYNRKVIQLLASDTAEFVKKAKLQLYEKEEG